GARRDPRRDHVGRGSPAPVRSTHRRPLQAPAGHPAPRGHPHRQSGAVSSPRADHAGAVRDPEAIPSALHQHPLQPPRRAHVRGGGGARPPRRRRRAARLPDGAVEGRERRSRGDEAVDAEAARRAGAAVLHLHVRPGGGRGALPHHGREGPGDHPGAARVDLRARRATLRDRRAGGRREDPAPARVRGVDQRRCGGPQELRRQAVRLPAAGSRRATATDRVRAGARGVAANPLTEPTDPHHISRVPLGAVRLGPAVFVAISASLFLGHPLALAGAQRPDSAVERYEPVVDELRKMQPQGERVASIRNVTLRRDVIEFHLDDGQLFLATPVAGRTVGAIFVGRGSVSLAPPIAIERRELKRVLGDSALNARISTAAFLFTDSTLVELGRQLTFGGGGVADRASGVLNDALDHLVDGRRVVQPTLMRALLNGDSDGFFYAHVKREHGEDLMFVVDPADDEQIAVLRSGREGEKVQVVSEFRRAEDLNDTATVEPARRAALKLNAYRIEATIAGGLGFSATATTRLTAQRAGVHWARLDLLAELEVDSVREESGRAVSFFRPSKTSELWVRFDPAPHVGDTLAVHVAYHGDLIGYTSITQGISRQWPGWVKGQLPSAPDRWLYVKTSYSWFPRYGEQAADVDLTFHTPKRYHLASIGRLVDSHIDGNTVTSHWVTARPADQVCFSIGEVDEFRINDPRIPPVTVHTNGEAHRQLDKFFLALRDQLGASNAFVMRFLS